MPRPRPALPIAAAAGAVVLLLAACSGPSAPDTPSATTSRPAASGRPAGLSYLFRYQGEAAGGAVLDSSGEGDAAMVQGAGGGTVDSRTDPAPVDDQAGRFLRFPSGQCTLPQGCPQALLEPQRPVNPGQDGAATFSFGARVRLHGEPGEAGENVLERGRAVAGQPQWKLQVDHGRASCRWSDGATVLLLPDDAGGSLPLDQDRWYELRCERRPGNVFAVVVLDPAGGRAPDEVTKAVPAMGAITPAGPVTIGAKRIGGPDLQTDQYRGDLDDIYFHTD